MNNNKRYYVGRLQNLNIFLWRASVHELILNQKKDQEGRSKSSCIVICVTQIK